MVATVTKSRPSRSRMPLGGRNVARAFEHVLLPVRCACGSAQSVVSLADLMERPVELNCGGCEHPVVIDARENAAQVAQALQTRANVAADRGLQLCTLALG